MTSGADSACLDELAQRIARETGLSFPPGRRRDLLEGIRDAAAELGFENERFALEDLVARPLARNRIQALARHLTIGETYFFRGRKFLEAFRSVVLPEALRVHASDRRLRIWSAGCASGEEPYSLAMMLMSAVQGKGEWDITVQATDINTAFLEKARQGIYGKWALRECSSFMRQRYFRAAGEGRWEVTAEVRKMVSFSCHNLVQDSFPQFMDIIVCKNVLMYFTETAAVQVLQGFRESLVDGGWLLVSPTESFLPRQAGFSAVPAAQSIAFAISPARQPASAEPSQVGEAPIADAPSEPLVAPPPQELQPAGAGSAILRARSCADRGLLDEAATWCRAAIAADMTNAESHFLLGTILSEQGFTREAELSLRTAISLQPDRILAHIALGGVARKRGKTREATRNFRNALDLLLRHDPHDVIPDSDGMTAERLSELVLTSMRETP